MSQLLIEPKISEPEIDARTPQLSWWQNFLIKVIRTGKIPRSVAIIMDGNRRFAVA